jgi:multidrug efflux pump subunit AcrB
LTPGQVGFTLRWLYGEDKVTELRRGDDLVQVVLAASPGGDDPLARVADTPIPSTLGGTVAIREAGSAVLGQGFAELQRRNGRRVVEISADVDGGKLPAEILKNVDRWLQSKKWDPGYGFAYGGAQDETERSFQSLGMAAIGGMILIFGLLVLMFASLRLSVVVMLAVPYAMIGAVSGLALTGNAFGFMAFLGLIALTGVYVNHKIYFVDRMRQLLNRGEDLASAMRHAGQDRLRPVVLTALTAILGLLPLTLTGGVLWGPFGWVNIFGLLASIPLSLILLPAFIALIYRVSPRRGAAAVPASAPRNTRGGTLPFV